MALSERQKGEIAYLRGALGIETLEQRLSKLESNEWEQPTLEASHDAGMAALAKVDTYPAQPYSPEGEPDPEPEEDEEEEVQRQAGEYDPDETATEANPANEAEDVDLEELLADEEERPEHYEDWTVNQLKAELADRGQPTSGNKLELIDRLRSGDSQ